MKVSKKEIAKFQAKEQRTLDGQTANAKEQRIERSKQQLVQSRKTGVYYDPKAKFDELMNKPEITDLLKRLTIR